MSQQGEGYEHEPDEVEEPVVFLEEEEAEDPEQPLPSRPPLSGVGTRDGNLRRKGRKAPGSRKKVFSTEERLLVLDTWLRSGLPGKDFSGLVGVSKHTLYSWKKRFEQEGPAGLEDRPRTRSGARLSEAARRSGCSRKVLRDRLRRYGLYVSPRALPPSPPSAACERTSGIITRPSAALAGWTARPPTDALHSSAFSGSLRRRN